MSTGETEKSSPFYLWRDLSTVRNSDPSVDVCDDSLSKEFKRVSAPGQGFLNPWL